VNYFDRISLSVAAPQLQQEFHLSSSDLGILFSAFFWTYALLQIPTGLILDRFGVTRVGRWGALLWGWPPP
jgi:sugar phosphate permease